MGRGQRIERAARVGAMALLLSIGAARASVAGSPSSADPYEAILDRIEAGSLDEAAQMLEAADLSENAELRARGALAMARGDAADAAKHFAAALALAEDPALRLHLAHAQLESGDAKGADATWARSDPEGAGRDLLGVRISIARERFPEAYARALAGLERAPAQLDLEVEALWLELELGLMHTARARGRAMLRAHCGVGDEGERVRRALGAAFAGDPGALPLLEALVACAPEDPEGRAGLAAAYARAGFARTSAGQYERALLRAPAARRSSWAEAAAQQRAAAGEHEAAEHVAMQVEDTNARLALRMELLFAAGSMARVVAVGEGAQALVQRRPELAYLLAYAHYRLNDRARATELCRGLLRGPQAANARGLLAAMGRRALAEEGE